MLNHARGLTAKFFPTAHHDNIGMYITSPGSNIPTAALMVDCVPNLDLFGRGGQFFPRYTWEAATQDPTLFGAAEGFSRVDNITDRILSDYRTAYGAGVTKDDIFYYVYGLMHSPAYRAEFAADLNKMLPRIPKVTRYSDFVRAGRELAALHLDYEEVTPYPLMEIFSGGNVNDRQRYRVQRMSFGRRRDTSGIIFNAHVVLSGIPDNAFRYVLGSRSAIEWILDRYQVTTNKDSGIRNDPNDWSDDPRYIVDLLKRIVTVSIETMKVVDSLPPLELIK